MLEMAVAPGLPPLASLYSAVSTPHFFWGMGGFAVVVWQRSMALTMSSGKTALSFCAVLHAGGATVSLVFASQSSSTMLPTNSKAPGLISFGLEQPSAALSQQSPLQIVQPSLSWSAPLSR